MSDSQSIRDRVRNLLGSETEEEAAKRKKEAEEKAKKNPPVDADRAAEFSKGFGSVK